MIDDSKLVDKGIRYRVRHSRNAGDSWAKSGFSGVFVQERSQGETVFRPFLTGFRGEVLRKSPKS